MGWLRDIGYTLLDWTHIDQNEFWAVNQFSIKGAHCNQSVVQAARLEATDNKRGKGGVRWQKEPSRLSPGLSARGV